MSVSKSLAIEITKEIDESVKAILAKHNLQLLKQSTKYGDEFNYTVKAVAVTLNETGVNLNSPEAQNWLAVGTSYGFKNPSDVLGGTFVNARKEYKFTGINMRKEKFPLSAIEIATGKQYGFPVKALMQLPNFDEAEVSTWIRMDMGLPIYTGTELKEFNPKAGN